MGPTIASLLSSLLTSPCPSSCAPSICDATPPTLHWRAFYIPSVHSPSRWCDVDQPSRATRQPNGPGCIALALYSQHPRRLFIVDAHRCPSLHVLRQYLGTCHRITRQCGEGGGASSTPSHQRGRSNLDAATCYNWYRDMRRSTALYVVSGNAPSRYIATASSAEQKISTASPMCSDLRASL